MRMKKDGMQVVSYMSLRNSVVLPSSSALTRTLGMPSSSAGARARGSGALEKETRAFEK